MKTRTTLIKSVKKNKTKKFASKKEINANNPGRASSSKMSCIKVSAQISPAAMRRIVHCTYGVMTSEEMIKRRNKSLKEYRDIVIP